jgi:hypothetical protein
VFRESTTKGGSQEVQYSWCPSDRGTKFSTRERLTVRHQRTYSGQPASSVCSIKGGGGELANLTNDSLSILIHKTRQTHVSTGEESPDAIRLTGIPSTTMKVLSVAFSLCFAIQAAMGLHCDSGCSACWKDGSPGVDIKIACGADNRWGCATGCPAGYSNQHCAEHQRCALVKRTPVFFRLTKRPLGVMIRVVNLVLVCVELGQVVPTNGVTFAEALCFIMFLCKYQVSS